MTTGRINQVTVLHARFAPHEAAGTGGCRRPLPRPELVTDRFKSSPVAGTARPLALSGNPSHSTAHRVPSPPISHASGALPRSVGPESAPSVETTVERPHLVRECFRNAAYLRSTRCGLSWPWAIRSTSLCFARNSVKGALQSSHSPGSWVGSTHPSRARPQTHPKRAHPARQAHQPLGPGTASHPPSSIPQAPGRHEAGGVDVGQPDGPSTQVAPLSKHPKSRNTRHTDGVGHRPSRLRPKRQTAERRATSSGSREPARLTR